MRRRACSFALFFFLVFVFSPLLPNAFAQTAPTSPELDTILKQIENRNYRWIAFRADVVLFFITPRNTRQSLCTGELLYERLQERLLLSCSDAEQNIVFVFRTLDRRFDLYIPSQNTLYHGSVFDLEDSPEIENHMKLIDLYRALKPGMFDPRRTKVELSSEFKISLNVFAKKNGVSYLARKAYVTPQGDVLGELFFDQEGQTITDIQRYDFKEFPADVGAFKSVFFPKKTTIISPRTGKNTAVFFNSVKPLDTVSSYEFLLRIPRETREVFLKEVDPRFSQAPMASGTNSLPGLGDGSVPSTDKNMAEGGFEPDQETPDAESFLTEAADPAAF